MQNGGKGKSYYKPYNSLDIGHFNRTTLVRKIMKSGIFKSGVFLTAFFFSCSTSDFTEDLGNGYTFVSESNVHQIISGPNGSWTGIVPCTVEAYDFDHAYIVVKQRSNPECLRDGISTLSIAYWIINKQRRSTYGPLDSLSFVMKRRELKVPASLNLK
ncbi:DUF3997 domain-containing protein [Pedobacter metabolipauper]|uniref:Uncharacterized protein DUF3997 n=1 Tax=Pedobacter metabolipauper TaxID=425513 RepID=A0A4V3D141_9SPHI|nr:DUF3997 domain-containing protein [Pedobacter metabolipauper]TDQ09207.1 uncharacterized protein DUF3997 [Pedobacter metabolipauper]